MFYAASKLALFLLLPSTLAFGSLFAGLGLAATGWRPRLGWRLVWGGVLAVLIGGLLPLGNALMLPLEQRFSGVPQPAAGDGFSGIIILGGFEDPWVSSGRGGLAVNEAAERLTEGVRLARMWPQAKVVFTGGSAAVLFKQEAAGGAVRRFLLDMGIAADRIVIEDRSRTTHENALLTRSLVKPEPGQRWVLVTSAWHMPRAVGVFRQAGFDVIPYPVDYRTSGPRDLMRTFERIPAGLDRLDVAAREWIGLLAYWLAGRSSALFPAP